MIPVERCVLEESHQHTNRLGYAISVTIHPFSAPSHVVKQDFLYRLVKALAGDGAS